MNPALHRRRCVEQVREQLARAPRPYPRLAIRPRRALISDYRFEDFAFENYDTHPHIAAPAAI